MANSKTVVVRDVEFNWAKITKPHSPFGTMQYDIQVVTDNEATKAQFESLGVKMKTRDDGAYYANVKRKAVNAKGVDNGPPVVLDADKEPMPNIKVIGMGNGSKGHIKLFSYDYNVAGRSGTAAMLVAIQVTDYVEYTGSSDNEDF